MFSIIVILSTVCMINTPPTITNAESDEYIQLSSNEMISSMSDLSSSTSSEEVSSIITDINVSSNVTESNEVEVVAYSQALAVQETKSNEQNTNTYSVPNIDTSFKSYTYYTMIDRKSSQWEFQKEAYTDENGLRKINDNFLVAVGSYYSDNLGDIFEITTSTGNVFKVIICDFKSDLHTDSTHRYTPTNGNNSLLEFYVDKNTLNSTAKTRGNISYINGFDGSITSIIKLN